MTFSHMTYLEIDGSVCQCMWTKALKTLSTILPNTFKSRKQNIQLAQWPLSNIFIYLDKIFLLRIIAIEEFKNEQTAH